MKLFNRFKQTPQDPEMRKAIMILQPSEKHSITRMDGLDVSSNFASADFRKIKTYNF